MSDLFTRLRARPFSHKAVGLFAYGLLTFAAIFLAGNVVFDNPIFFRVFEFLWFVHVVIVCNQLQRSQAELLGLALLALSPGIVNNLLSVVAF